MTPRPTWRSSGRYVLTPKIFDKLEQTQRGAGGEIQLTDAIEALMQEQEVYAYAFEGTRYDAGTTMGWLKASVELALQRPGPRRPSSATTCGASRSSLRAGAPVSMCAPLRPARSRTQRRPRPPSVTPTRRASFCGVRCPPGVGVPD